jgi:hypothetical protein
MQTLLNAHLPFFSRSVHGRFCVVAGTLALLLACGDTSSGDDDGESTGGGGGGGGGDGGGVTYDRTGLNDGSTGSACGTCSAGLTCDTTAEGGYCTRSCTGECAAGALCYDVGGSGACLRACSRDLDCRLGYSCQGDPGSTVCFPAEEGDGGTSERPANGTPGPGDDEEEDDNPVAGDCNVRRLPDNTTGGCRIRLVTPAECEVIDLRNGATYEFAWTADGTGCETPWTLNIGGDPDIADNAKYWELATNVEQGISRTGGIIYLRASDLDGIQSEDGVYQWVVSSFYGSYPESQAFRVLR